MRARLNFFYNRLLMAVFAVACSSVELPPVKTADNLDVDRYMGLWHEIARLPFPFEDDCFGASAKYEKLSDEEFLITNFCWKKSYFGPMRQAHAQAWIEDTADASKFKVSFFWPFALDYWILYVDNDYKAALVGTPDRKYLWILSRTFAMDDAVYQQLVAQARSKGFDVSQLIRAPQRSEETPPATEPEKTDENEEGPTQGGPLPDGGTPDGDTDPPLQTPTQG